MNNNITPNTSLSCTHCIKVFTSLKQLKAHTKYLEKKTLNINTSNSVPEIITTQEIHNNINSDNLEKQLKDASSWASSVKIQRDNAIHINKDITHLATDFKDPLYVKDVKDTLYEDLNSHIHTDFSQANLLSSFPTLTKTSSTAEKNFFNNSIGMKFQELHDTIKTFIINNKAAHEIPNNSSNKHTKTINNNKKQYKINMDLEIKNITLMQKLYHRHIKNKITIQKPHRDTFIQLKNKLTFTKKTFKHITNNTNNMTGVELIYNAIFLARKIIFKKKKKSIINKQSKMIGKSIIQLYYQNPKLAYEHIMEGKDKIKCEIDVNTVYEHYKKEATGLASTNINISDPPWLNYPEILATLPEIPNEIDDISIDEEELKQSLKRTKNSSAAGGDAFSYKLLKLLPSLLPFLTLLYETCRASGYFPDFLKFGHTILIYKKGDKTLITNWRPICLLSIFYKLFTSIIANRIQNYNMRLLKKIFSIDQRGFLKKISGCHINNFIFNEYLKAFENNKEKLVGSNFWLDFANAFGSVDHKLINYCTKYLNLPNYLQSIIENLYNNSFFQVKVGSTYTSPILLERGVKQGDGLSPILFNLCLELLLRWLNVDNNTKINDVKLSFLGYADDVNILELGTDKKTVIKNMNNHITKLQIFSEFSNIKINGDKCQSSLISKTVKSKAQSHPTNIKNGDNLFPHLNKQDSYKTLGTHFDMNRKFYRIHTDLKGKLQNILTKLSLAKIPNWMKLKLFNIFAFSKFTFPMYNGEITITNLKLLDKIIRKAIRSWFSLPPCSSVDFFYTNAKYCGLHAKSLELEYKKMKLLNLATLFTTKDTKVNEIFNKSYQNEIIRLNNLLPGNENIIIFEQSYINPTKYLQIINKLQNLKINHKLDHFWYYSYKMLHELNLELKSSNGNNMIINISDNTVIKINKLGKLITNHNEETNLKSWKNLKEQGAIIRDFEKYDCSLLSFHWFNKYPHKLLPIQIEWGLKVLLQLIPCNNNKKRWKMIENAKCNYCNYDKETTGHVLNYCLNLFRKNLMTIRHNGMLQLISNKLLDLNISFTIDQTPLFSLMNSTFNGRPDIMVYNMETKSCTIVDVKSNFTNFDKSHEKNINKYKIIKSKSEKIGWKTDIFTFIISSAGLILNHSFRALEALKLTKNSNQLVTDASISVIRNGFSFYNTLSRVAL